MTKRSKVELFEQIRRARRLEPGVSVRELSRRFETHRRTVREALASAVPAPRRPVERASPVLDEWKPIIDACLALVISTAVAAAAIARVLHRRSGWRRGRRREPRRAPGPGVVDA